MKIQKTLKLTGKIIAVLFLGILWLFFFSDCLGNAHTLASMPDLWFRSYLFVIFELLISSLLFAAILYMLKHIKIFNIYMIIVMVILCFTFYLTQYRNHKNAIYYATPQISEQDFDLTDYTPKGEKTARLDENPTVTIEKDFPNIDGATALYPLYSAAAQAIEPDVYFDCGFGMGLSFVCIVDISCSKTGGAYYGLIEGHSDIIFVGGPSQEQLEKAQEAGVKLNLTPIAKEAFVFIVNKDNPVNNLSSQQLKDIYAGRIKLWRQVGGKWEFIKPFQRPQNSGSQTAFEKFMEGVKIMPARQELVATSMGSLVESLAEYRNFSSAIGYSFRFFVNEMSGNKDVKILSIDGVYPDERTIRDGSYPISLELYAVTSDQTENKNPNTKVFINWLLSPQGQRLVEKVGYIPLYVKR
jgi:phosphate transport system substrate-binding protein